LAKAMTTEGKREVRHVKWGKTRDGSGSVSKRQ